MSAILEWTAVALGLVYLLGAVQQWRWCWIAGGISAGLFLIVFHEADLPIQALLQAYYMAVAVHGWWHWGAADPGSTGLSVQQWPITWHLVAIAVVALLVVATVALRGSAIELSPTLDAATGWGSALATWLVARKVLENWLYWIVIDSAAVVLYLHNGLGATAALYALYTLIALLGWLKWRQTLSSAQPPSR